MHECIPYCINHVNETFHFDLKTDLEKKTLSHFNVIKNKQYS